MNHVLLVTLIFIYICVISGQVMNIKDFLCNFFHLTEHRTAQVAAALLRSFFLPVDQCDPCCISVTIACHREGRANMAT